MARLKALQDILMEKPKFIQVYQKKRLARQFRLQRSLKPLVVLSSISSNSKNEERKTLAAFSSSHSNDRIFDHFMTRIAIRPHVRPHQQ